MRGEYAFKLRSLAWPRTTARARLPVSVPKAFGADYKEGCAVIDLSPKAAAALARRGLQHLLHERLKIKARDLSAEIDELLAQKVLPTRGPAARPTVGRTKRPPSRKELRNQGSRRRDTAAIGLSPSSRRVALWASRLSCFGS
jgi:hypothetical protein